MAERQVEKKTWLGLSDMDLLQAVGESVARASVCWDNVENAGEYDTAIAGEIVDQLMDRIEKEFLDRNKG